MGGIANGNKSPLAYRMIGIVQSSRQRIVEHIYCLVERDAVFFEISPRFVTIPFKLHSKSLTVARELRCSAWLCLIRIIPKILPLCHPGRPCPLGTATRNS